MCIRDRYKSDGTISFTYYDYSTGTCALKSTKTGTYTYDSTNKKLTTILDGVSSTSDVYNLTSIELQVKTGEVDYNLSLIHIYSWILQQRRKTL